MRISIRSAAKGRSRLAILEFLTSNAWQLVAVGALFAGLSAINALLKTILRRHKTGYFDLALLLLAILPPFAALLTTYNAEIPDTSIAPIALLLAGGIAVVYLLITILEFFRQQRLRGSRGLLGLSGAIFLAISTFTLPFIWAYTALNAEPQSVAGAATSTPSDGEDPIVVAGTPTGTPDAEQRFANLFRSILTYAADTTGLGVIAIIDQLESGTSFARIVIDNGGDLELVIDQIAVIMRQILRDATDAGQVNPVQAALALSQMETFIRFMVNSDITGLGDRMGGGTPDPEGTRPSLRALFETPTAGAATATATGTTAADDATVIPTVPATNAPNRVPTTTPTASPTAPSTPSPRPAQNTPTPSATRFTFSTRTPLPTLTPVTPCLASVEYNLRLRSAPTLEGETLAVIPFGTTVELFARGGLSSTTAPDAFWWQAEYDGLQGWLDGQYMIVSRACAALPTVVTR